MTLIAFVVYHHNIKNLNQKIFYLNNNIKHSAQNLQNSVNNQLIDRFKLKKLETNNLKKDQEIVTILI
jgi:hypothetical protein